MSKNVKQHKVVRLTEEQFHTLLSESIEKVLNDMIVNEGIVGAVKNGVLGALGKIGKGVGNVVNHIADDADSKKNIDGHKPTNVKWFGTEKEGGPHKGGVFGYAIGRLLQGKGPESFKHLALSNRDREERNKAKKYYEAGQQNTYTKFDDFWDSENNSSSSSNNSSSSNSGNYTSTNNYSS